MSNTAAAPHPNPLPLGEGNVPPPREILRRVLLQLFLFALVLTTLLLLSWVLIIPGFGRIEIGGTVRGIAELTAHRNHLTADIASFRERRDATLLPLRDSSYGELVYAKASSPHFLTLRAHIQEVALRLVPEEPDAVTIDVMRFDVSTLTFEIAGRIQRVGPRSMTVLAQFIEELRAIPGVTALHGARFAREQDASGAFFSPFQLSLIFGADETL